MRAATRDMRAESLAKTNVFITKNQEAKRNLGPRAGAPRRRWSLYRAARKYHVRASCRGRGNSDIRKRETLLNRRDDIENIHWPISRMAASFVSRSVSFVSRRQENVTVSTEPVGSGKRTRRKSEKRETENDERRNSGSSNVEFR